MTNAIFQKSVDILQGLCYTIIVPRERDRQAPNQGRQFSVHPRPLKKIRKKLKKGLDKSSNLWYNKITKGELNSTNRERVDTMTKTDKMTNRKALEIAIAAIGDTNADATAKLSKMIEQLDKKNAAPKKLTAQQEKNVAMQGEILDFLLDNEGTGYTVSDLLKSVPSLEGDSNQHVSALMRALVLAGSVEKYTDKRRTYFRAIAAA